MAHCKRCMNVFCWGALAYFGYKIYRYITGVINISRELPVYLKNVVGESPCMNMNMVFNRLTVTLSFSEDIITEHSDLAEMAQEYILRYYPIFRQDHVSLKIVQKERCEVAEMKEQDMEEAKEVPEKLEPETE